MKFGLKIQYFGRGRSKAGGGGGGGAQPNQPQPQPQPQQATTPSGITYDQFMQMTDQQKYQTMQQIIDDPNIVVPAYLDNSVTSKVIYGLGMNNATNVVSDAQLDQMQGRELFRTVYDAPVTTSDEILDQIRNGEYTQLSNSGGSVHGRALYFATDFQRSAVYGRYESNPMVMRAKLDPNAKIRSESSLYSQMSGDLGFRNSSLYGKVAYSSRNSDDTMSLYALSHGIDGWYSSRYTMILNRGVLTSSSQNKRIGATNTKSGNVTIVNSWQQAANAH